MTMRHAEIKHGGSRVPSKDGDLLYWSTDTGRIQGEPSLCLLLACARARYVKCVVRSDDSYLSSIQLSSETPLVLKDLFG
jgi:hypothetical protein